MDKRTDTSAVGKILTKKSDISDLSVSLFIDKFLMSNEEG
jgi:hypothetical protein